jgi:hypothetical protein
MGKQSIPKLLVKDSKPPEDIRLLVCVPTGGSPRINFCTSLASFMGLVGSEGLPSKRGCMLSVDMNTVVGCIIHRGREELVDNAIKYGATHILFLDDDIEFDPNVVDLLFSRNKEIVVTNYLVKNKTFDRFVAVDFDGKPISTLKESTGILPVMYSGFGVSLIQTKIFKDMPKPWFLPGWDNSQEHYIGEDVAFSINARKAGYQTFLDHDASKLIRGHHGMFSWNWKNYTGG